MEDTKIIWHGSLVPFDGDTQFSCSAKIIKRHEVLEACYFVAGPVNLLENTGPQWENSFRDELWKSTCFELFTGRKDSSYLEWNLSCSGHWACYEFDAYRKKKLDLRDQAPNIRFQKTNHRLEFTASLANLSNFNSSKGQDLLPTIILKIAGRQEAIYFAPQHPPQNPDFHKREYWLHQGKLAAQNKMS